MYVDGFYQVTSPQEGTFYVTSDTPSKNVEYGWRGQFFTGIAGQIEITGINRETDQDYNWSFTFWTDTDQSVEDAHNVEKAIINPPDKENQFALFGSYTTVNGYIQFKYKIEPPAGDWIALNLPTYQGPMVVSDGVFRPLDGTQLDDNPTEIFVRGFPSILLKRPFVPGAFLKATYVNINPKLVTGNFPKLRSLNRDTTTDDIFKENPYIESRGRGFSSGSILSLKAIGPQEAYLLTDDMTRSMWNPEFKRYTNFSIYQKIYDLPTPNPCYQGQTVTMELRPTELGHLLSNMYLNVTLPALPSGIFYTDHVGRAIIQKVELMANETVIETLFDDWYQIRDQLFLGTDDILGLYEAVGGTNLSGPLNLVIPLEFFFCRRHSNHKNERSRMSRPYFPACAMWNQKLYIRFTFNSNTWWSNTNDPTLDFGNASLITEEILLENSEKIFYQNTKRNFIVNRVLKNAAKTYNTPSTVIDLSGNYPVQLITWFFRNTRYENDENKLQYNNRYNYGYSTQYINIPEVLQFPSGNVNYVDVVSTMKITLDNVDICSNFQGSLYYTFKQPMDHSLSVPSKDIYMYSFGLSPKEYNEGGYLNFGKLNSHTTSLTIKFLPQYTSEIANGYNLYVFYYGYSLLTFEGGFASVPLI